MMQPPFPPDNGSLLTPPTMGGAASAPGFAVPEYASDILGAPSTQQKPRTALERWSQREYKKNPDQLSDEKELEKLSSWVLEEAEQGATRWQGRNERMKDDQRAFGLRGSEPGTLGHREKTAEDKRAAGISDVMLPDNYVVPTKVANMLTSPGVRFNIPAHRLTQMSQVQKVENFAAHLWRELRKRMGQGINSDLMRRISHFLVLRGWVAILVMPDSEDETFPYRVRVPDPMEVYPEEDSDGNWVAATHQLTMSVRKAHGEYPEAADMLDGYNDNDTVTCVGYYDLYYHTIILKCGSLSDKSKSSSMVLKRPMLHGVTTLQGKPKLPWVITLAMGNLSEGGDDATSPDTTLVGPGILYAMREMVDIRSMVFSMLLAQTDRSTNPATVDYIRRGQTPPAPLSLESGARNYREDDGGTKPVQMLDTAPNPGNLMPMLQMATDALNKAALPAVAYGDGGSIQSGFGIGRLLDPALDLITPFKTGVINAIDGLIQRLLEITGTITVQTHQTLPMTAKRGFLGGTLSVDFEPGLIAQAGTIQVDVQFGEVTAQDKAILMGWIGPAVQMNLIPRQTAREELGYQDTQFMAQQIAFQDVRENPVAAAMLGDMSAFGSDEEAMKFLAYLNQQLQAQAAAQGAEPGQPGQGGPQNTPAMPTGTLPVEQQAGANGMAGQAPPRDDPSAQVQRRMNAAQAMINGGSQPAPPR